MMDALGRMQACRATVHRAEAGGIATRVIADKAPSCTGAVTAKLKFDNFIIPNYASILVSDNYENVCCVVPPESS